MKPFTISFYLGVGLAQQLTVPVLNSPNDVVIHEETVEKYNMTALRLSMEEQARNRYPFAKRHYPATLINRTAGPGKGDCHKFPDGAAPLPDKTNWQGFVEYENYSTYANNATTPANYVKAFQDYNASVQSPTYLVVHTVHVYDPDLCARHCDNHPGCKAFNTYISRDPSRDPGPECPNPPATANFKCTLFGDRVSSELATNTGQYQPPADVAGQAFVVKIKASNGYNRNGTPQQSSQFFPINGFSGPLALPGAVNASAYNVDTGPTLMGTQYFNASYNPSLCTRLCDAVSSAKQQQAKEVCDVRAKSKVCPYSACDFVNMYSLADQAGFYCAVFSAPMLDESTTVTSIRDYLGDEQEIGFSWGYVRNPADSDTVTGRPYQTPRFGVQRFARPGASTGPLTMTITSINKVTTAISPASPTFTVTVTKDLDTLDDASRRHRFSYPLPWISMASRDGQKAKAKSETE